MVTALQEGRAEGWRHPSWAAPACTSLTSARTRLKPGPRTFSAPSWPPGGTAALGPIPAAPHPRSQAPKLLLAIQLRHLLDGWFCHQGRRRWPSLSDTRLLRHGKACPGSHLSVCPQMPPAAPAEQEVVREGLVSYNRARGSLAPAPRSPCGRAPARPARVELARRVTPGPSTSAPPLATLRGAPHPSPHG